MSLAKKLADSTMRVQRILADHAAIEREVMEDQKWKGGMAAVESDRRFADYLRERNHNAASAWYDVRNLRQKDDTENPA